MSELDKIFVKVGVVQSLKNQSVIMSSLYALLKGSETSEDEKRLSKKMLELAVKDTKELFIVRQGGNED